MRHQIAPERRLWRNNIGVSTNNGIIALNSAISIVWMSALSARTMVCDTDTKAANTPISTMPRKLGESVYQKRENPSPYGPSG